MNGAAIMPRPRASFPLGATATCLLVAACLLVSTPRALQQAGPALYLVSGYPTDDPDLKVATRLYRTSPDTKGSAEVLELSPASDIVSSIRAYHDKRLLTVARASFEAAAGGYVPTRLILLNMDDPCRPRVLNVASAGFLPLNTHLLDIPDKGLYFAEVGFSIEDKNDLFYTINLLTGQPETLDAAVLRYARLAGLSGLGIEDRYQMNLLVDPGGSLVRAWKDQNGKRAIDLGWPALPPADRPAQKKARWSIGGIERAMGDATWFVGTAEFDFVYPREEPVNPNALRFLLLDKSQRTW